MPLVRMKAAPVKTDGERLGNEFMNGVFFSTHMMNDAWLLPGDEGDESHEGGMQSHTVASRDADRSHTCFELL